MLHKLKNFASSFILFLLLFFCLPFPLFGASLDETNLLKFALKAYNDGLYDLAIEEFEKYVKQYPKGEEADLAAFLIGESFRSKKNLDEAMKAYKRVTDSYPQSDFADDALYLQGKLAYEKGNDSNAAELLQAFTVKYPKSAFMPLALYWLGEAHFHLKAYQKAIIAYQKIVESYPKSEVTDYSFYSLGWSYQLLGDYPKALANLKKVEALFPESKVLRSSQIKVGEILFSLKEYANVVKQFEPLLKKEGNSEQQDSLLFYLAESYYNLGEYDKSGKTYQGFLSKFPGHTLIEDALYGLAWSFYKGEQYAEAAETFQKLSGQFPKSHYLEVALFRSAIAYSQRGRREEALAFYEKVVEQFPDGQSSLPSLIAIGRISFDLKKLDRSLEAYKKLLTFPSIPSEVQLLAHATIAQISLLLGKHEEAIVHYTSLLEGGAKSDYLLDALYGRGVAYYTLQGFKKAADDFQALLKEDTNKRYQEREKTLLYLSQSHVKLEMWEEALSAYETLLKEYPDSSYAPDALYYSALLLDRLKRVDKAIEAYERFNKNYPRQAEEKEYNGYLRGGRLLHQQGRVPESIISLLKASQSKNGAIAAESTYWLAEAYISQKEYDKAIERLQAIPQTYPSYKSWTNVAYSRVGVLYEEQERWDDAVKAYKSVRENQGDEGLVKKARERIAAIEKFKISRGQRSG
ncbi:MAG: tetratricopeptide repeat protein, partial [Candidatus Tectomicrobia bacterium]|nr:tetratricopeptide repeat protein [Candidatus Tectomicrobia bacterium]